MESDAELVTAVLAGDREAFAGLVERYERAVRATAVAVVHDHHVAQDIAQATDRPVGTVTGLLSRARDRLRRWLKESES